MFSKCTSVRINIPFRDTVYFLCYFNKEGNFRVSCFPSCTHSPHFRKGTSSKRNGFAPKVSIILGLRVVLFSELNQPLSCSKARKQIAELSTLKAYPYFVIGGTKSARLL